MRSIHDHGLIRRERTAISRTELSRPMRLGLAAGLISTDRTVLDFGCGRGDDVRGLQAQGIECWGWDPVHQAQGRRSPADVVNLGYVINVIEEPEERAKVLQEAWDLARQVLIVSARMPLGAQQIRGREYSDGCLTQKNTFQKFFTHDELRNWIDTLLSVQSVAAGPGIFLVFRNEILRLSFSASQYRRISSLPHQHRADSLFEQHKTVLEPLVAFFANRGRLPEREELGVACDLESALGSIPRAFAVVRRVTGADRWDEIIAERTQDLLIYWALARFSGRPRFSELPSDMRLDIRAFFGTYNTACTEADRLLFSAGDMAAIDSACREAPCGKLTPGALYVHAQSVSFLQPILRVYEGCARRYIGTVEGANLIKMHRQKPQISYLSYPDFDKQAHPALIGSLVVPLQTFEVRYQDYINSTNPFILHRKEEMVHTGYPGRERFSRLTAQEERRGLYDNANSIGTRDAWNELLRAKNLRISGHRLVRRGQEAKATTPGASSG